MFMANEGEEFMDLQVAAKATWLAASAGRMYLTKDIADLFILLVAREMVNN